MSRILPRKNASGRVVWLRLLLLITFSAASLQPAFAKKYEGLSAEVPFKFKIGDRTFRAGTYQLIIVGTNLLVLRDAHGQAVASLVTRIIDNGEAAPANKLVFKLENKHKRLAQIVIVNRSQALEVVGEQVAMRPSEPPAKRLPDWVIESLFQREGAPGMKQ